MAVTSKGSIMSAYPGANNMVGKVDQVFGRGDSEQHSSEGDSGGAALPPYPHIGSFPGPVNKAEQHLGNV